MSRKSSEPVERSASAGDVETRWDPPAFEEIKMDAEIGAYQADEGVAPRLPR